MTTEARLNIPLKLPSLREYSRDARLLLALSGISAVVIYGIQGLLRSLYLLRLGFGTVYIGSYLGTHALAYMAMGIPSGALGSRFGTRKVMRVGGIICLAGMAMLPATELLPVNMRAILPILSQLVQICGWSMVIVNIVPATMHHTSSQNRNNAYALTNGLREFGSLLGALVGGFLPVLFGQLQQEPLNSPGPYRSALLVGIALWLVALVPIFMIRSGEALPRKVKMGSTTALPVLPLAVMGVYIFTREASWCACQSFCTPYMDQALHYSPATMGMITAFGRICAILASLSVPKLLKKLNTGVVLIAATMLIGFSLLLLILSTHWVAVTLGRLGVFVAMALWLPTMQVYLMETVEERLRGFAYGAMSTVQGLGFATISYTGGYIIAVRDYNSLFLLGIILSAVALC